VPVINTVDIKEAIEVKTIIGILLLAGLLAAVVPMQQQIQILRSARQSDIANYYAATGVVIEDTPTISPFFACLRAYIYQNYTVNGTLMVDRISCPPTSFYSEALKGIHLCNKGDQSGRLFIDETMAYPFSYEC